MITPRGRDFGGFVDEEEEGGGTRERPLWPWLVAAAFVIAAIIAAFFVWNQLSGGGVKEPVGLYVGLRVGQAEQQIRNAHLVPVEKKQACTRYGPGRVCSQNPQLGVKIAKGGTVTLYVSTGKPTVVIPNVVGQTWQQAKQALLAAKLRPVEHNVPGGKTKGVVSGTDPGVGKSVQQGSPVKVNVTSGPQILLPVPGVQGEPLSQAENDLHNAGFNVSVVGYTNSTLPQNSVVSQTPQPNSQEPQGTYVKLTLSNGPPQVTVPPVVGETSQQAIQQLEHAGFKVNQQYQNVTDPSQDNIVQSQTPTGGQSAPKGSTVTIVVGQFSPGGPTTTG